LLKLPLFAVGERSAEAARSTGFTAVTSAGGSVRDLVRLLRQRKADAGAPLLYLAGEDRAADLIGELAAVGVAAEMRVVYRVATVPFPDELVAALEAGDVQAVLHFSRRSAENYVSGAREAGITDQALAVRHYCLSAQVAEPVAAAGAKRVTVAPRPEEAALIELLPLSAA
jgi:uroporphyrinogen-III synthase